MTVSANPWSVSYWIIGFDLINWAEYKNYVLKHQHRSNEDKTRTKAHAMATQQYHYLPEFMPEKQMTDSLHE